MTAQTWQPWQWRFFRIAFALIIILASALLIFFSQESVTESPRVLYSLNKDFSTHTLDNQQPSTSQRNVEPTTMGEGHPATTSGVTTQSSHKPANETSQYSSSLKMSVTTKSSQLAMKTQRCKPLPWPWVTTSSSGDKQNNIKAPIYGIPTPGDEHIIFVETSCFVRSRPTHLNAKWGSLSPRAACAVESAARAHPSRLIYVLNTCNDHADSLQQDALAAFALGALSLPNVRLWNQRLGEVFVDSPLEEWLLSGALRKSLFLVNHSSDVLRMVVLWKYGGTYLDTDVLVLRSFGENRNWGCAESEASVSVGAMHMSLDDVGRRVTNACLVEVRDRYNPYDWAFNGPGAFTRALRAVCKVSKVKEMTANHCGGFRLLPTNSFYAISYTEWKRYFQEEGAEETLKRLKDSLGAHVWNALSHDTEVDLFSCQPYAQLARHVCPSVVSALNGIM